MCPETTGPPCAGTVSHDIWAHDLGDFNFEKVSQYSPCKNQEKCRVDNLLDILLNIYICKFLIKNNILF